jgi:hypothetical protein
MVELRCIGLQLSYNIPTAGLVYHNSRAPFQPSFLSPSSLVPRICRNFHHFFFISQQRRSSEGPAPWSAKYERFSCKAPVLIIVKLTNVEIDSAHTPSARPIRSLDLECSWAGFTETMGHRPTRVDVVGILLPRATRS